MEETLLLKLKNFFHLKISTEEQKEFDLYILTANIKRGKMTAVTFLVLEAAAILFSCMVKRDTLLREPQRYYLLMYAVMIASMTVFLLFFRQFEKNIDRNRRAIWTTGILFAGFILLWCAGITLLDQLTSGQIIVFTVAVICVAVVPFYSPVTLFFIYLGTEGVFLLLLPAFQKSEGFLFNNSLNSASYVVLSWAIAHMMYKNKIYEFHNGKIIREKNEELQRINGQLTLANQTLEKLAVTDGLTNVYNRSYFDRTVRREWNRCQRGRAPIALIMIDIDYFKEFNDHYGHPAGDRCVRQIAGVLASCVRRSSDSVTRYGGDEFAVLLPCMESDQVSLVAHKIKEEIKNLAIPHRHSPGGPVVSVSVGAYTVVPDSGIALSEFINIADKALYEAKKTRDHVVVT
ncbi:sensor domain-containing diguanylate cyclase [Caproiciproducens faecalis]|uniref:GGDEF domain-containing protein n=1 Tax=Caproiciproducens faecalis TaxID=2820301 RepID=A0ABS7DPB4_9FIRM|nr:GGDEF domain-containing protein [Caproiciproducens faecalis]MBW7572386.1 GGDEF domain-containing protein [Caproiciproducens faecalis]